MLLKVSTKLKEKKANSFSFVQCLHGKSNLQSVLQGSDCSGNQSEYFFSFWTSFACHKLCFTKFLLHFNFIWHQLPRFIRI